PSKNVQVTGYRIRPRRVHLHAESRWLTNTFGSSRRRERPGRCLTLVKTEHAPNFWVDLQLLKIGRLFGPLHAPTDAADQIALVSAIPRRSSDFDKQEPAQRGPQKTSRELQRQSFRRQWHCRRRHAGLHSGLLPAEQVRERHRADENKSDDGVARDLMPVAD